MRSGHDARQQQQQQQQPGRHDQAPSTHAPREFYITVPFPHSDIPIIQSFADKSEGNI